MIFRLGFRGTTLRWLEAPVRCIDSPLWPITPSAWSATRKKMYQTSVALHRTACLTASPRVVGLGSLWAPQSRVGCGESLVGILAPCLACCRRGSGVDGLGWVIIWTQRLKEWVVDLSFSFLVYSYDLSYYHTHTLSRPLLIPYTDRNTLITLSSSAILGPF